MEAVVNEGSVFCVPAAWIEKTAASKLPLGCLEGPYDLMECELVAYGIAG
jgi:hypothetical protein